MFPDYQECILLDYYLKRDAGTLSPRLARPTPATIKDECLSVCKKRFVRKDDPILLSFFDSAGDEKIHQNAIENCDTDKFRPVLNFIKRKTVRPEQRVVELLAWLIDFEPRPFVLGKDYEELKSRLKTQTIAGGGNPTGTPIVIPVGNSPNGPGNKWRRWTLIALLVVVILGTGTYYLLTQKSNIISKSNDCMYWNKDHYEPIDCSVKMSDVPIVPLSVEQADKFKLVTQQDTITHNSAGKLWYYKVDDQTIECYTAPGYHPVKNKPLKSLTHYIINKYILKIQY